MLTEFRKYFPFEPSGYLQKCKLVIYGKWTRSSLL